MTKKWEVVIIGAGLAGYVAANFLGKSGLSVLLLEKTGKVGGRAITDKVKKNLLNLGPHAFYKRGSGKVILEELNIKLVGKSPKTKGTLLENNTFYEAPFSAISIMKTNLLKEKERLEWFNVLLKLSLVDPNDLVGITFLQWVEQTAASERVRSLLYILGRLSAYCHSPNITPANVIVSHMKLAMKGAIYLDGGWQRIVDQLHSQALSLGIDIRKQAAVKQIATSEDAGVFRIILGDGQEIYGENIIYTAEPAKLNTLLKSDFGEMIFYDRIKPVTAATLDVALTKLPNPKRLFAMGIEKPFYYSVHSIYAKLSEEDNNVVLHVLKYFSQVERIDRMEVKRELETFLETVQPGWREYEITSRCLPHITVNHRLPHVGDENILKQSETGIPGLFVAGDWASPDWLLSEAAISSGKRAAEEIMKRKGSSLRGY